MAKDIFSKAKVICEPDSINEVIAKTEYDELYRTYMDEHFNIYGERREPCFQEFKLYAKEFTTTYGLDLEDKVTHRMLVRLMEINRDENDYPYNQYCSPKMLVNKVNWRKVKAEFSHDLDSHKKLEKPTREYFGIEEHPLYVILNNGLSQTKVMKSKCHSVIKDNETFYYPKDNRLKSQYDFTGLQEFLGLEKEYDFGQVPVINHTPCYGFYVCSTYPKTCSYKCGKFKKLKYLLKASEIPEKYLYPIPHTEAPTVSDSKDMTTQVLLDIKSNIVEYVQEGESFVFYSDQTGTGKTSWACTIAKHFIYRRMMKNMLEPESVYINVPEYFATLKSAFGLKDDNLNLQILQLNNLIKDVPLLVIDDLGAEKGTEYTRDTLYQIINYRYSNGLSTIYTTNLLLDSDEAKDHLGKRIISRLQESTIIDFSGEVK